MPKIQKVHIPTGKPAGCLLCPHCGNARGFVEVAENVLMTTRYRQNTDGSFTRMENATEIFGDIGLYCEQCGADMTRFLEHFREMSF